MTRHEVRPAHSPGGLRTRPHHHFGIRPKLLQRFVVLEPRHVLLLTVHATLGATRHTHRNVFE